MTTGTMPQPELGQGVYTIPEAARVLGLVHGQDAPSLRRVRSWLADGLSFGTSETEFGFEVLSFLDLISLETVNRLTDYLSVRRIKQLEAEIRRDFPDLKQPYANQIFYTSGQSVWMKYQDFVVEVGKGRHRGHLVLKKILTTFAAEIRFNDEGVATRWVPNDHMEINPHVQFGAPVVRNTRIPVSTIVSNLKAGTPQQVADWYGLSAEQVEGLATYLSLKAA